MRILFALLILLGASSSSAITFEVVGKSGKSWHYEKRNVQLPATLGAISIAIFDERKIPYVGGEYGVSSLYGVGSDLVVISDSEMKSYGWCFELDGEITETMANETDIINPHSVIRWFYAFAHYLDGKWVSQCEKAD